MVNSKKKGSKFERTVAKWFESWTGYKFGRTPGSGSFHQNRDLTSDVNCIDEKHAHRCKISIECKCYKEIKFEHVLLGNKNCDIIRFWDQAKGDAERGKKVPILCMRYNSMPANEFFFVVGSELASSILNKDIISTPNMVINASGKHLYIFMASSVIKHVNYKDVHKQAKLSLKK